MFLIGNGQNPGGGPGAMDIKYFKFYRSAKSQSDVTTMYSNRENFQVASTAMTITETVTQQPSSTVQFYSPTGIAIDSDLSVWNEDDPKSYSGGVDGAVLTSQGAGKPPKWVSSGEGETATPAAVVSNAKVYGGIWCDGDYIISTYTLWGGEGANPIGNINNAGTTDWDFVNSHPNMWISPDTSATAAWNGKTGNGNILQIPRDGYYHIEMKQLIHNSVWKNDTITTIEMWMSRLPPGPYADAWVVGADIIGAWKWGGPGSWGHWAHATYIGFCKEGDRIFGQFYVESSSGIIIGDGTGHPAAAVAADTQAHPRSSGFSVFSID